MPVQYTNDAVDCPISSCNCMVLSRSRTACPRFILRPKHMICKLTTVACTPPYISPHSPPPPPPLVSSRHFSRSSPRRFCTFRFQVLVVVAFVRVVVVALSLPLWAGIPSSVGFLARFSLSAGGRICWLGFGWRCCWLISSLG